jgi:site-specific recombinase XerC
VRSGAGPAGGLVSLVVAVGDNMKGTGRKRGRKLPEVLTQDEQARLLALVADNPLPSSIRSHAILRVLLDTGLRASELINLRLKDLDLATGRLWVRQGKGQKDRGLWFNGSCRLALESWLAIKSNTSSESVFTSLDGQKPLCGRWLRRHIKALGEQIGVPWLHVHSLRHVFATRFLREGGNLFWVMKALGHANLSTTQIYLEIEDEPFEAAMKGLGG